MRFSVIEAVSFEYRPQELVIKPKHLEKEFTVLNVIRFGAMIASNSPSTTEV